MLMCPEGVKFLADDKLLKELSQSVVEIEAVSSTGFEFLLADPNADVPESKPYPSHLFGGSSGELALVRVL
jgi:hypothetical protein